MPSRPRPLPLVLGLVLGVVLALVAGCSSGATDRKVGDPVTQDEANTLAQLLHQNFEKGGADFVVSAPFAEGTVLTLTGKVDFTRSIGTAKAVTHYTDGRPDDTRTIYFTPRDVWFGDLPGLPAAAQKAGLPAGVQYVRRPISSAAQTTESPVLVDVLVQLVLNLSSRSDDDPRAILERHYTWQGQRSIDGHLASLYDLSGGKSVAVGASDKLMRQYVAPLGGQERFTVTITLADHGKRDVELPPDSATVNAADHPDLANELGV